MNTIEYKYSYWYLWQYNTIKKNTNIVIDICDKRNSGIYLMTGRSARGYSSLYDRSDGRENKQNAGNTSLL